MSVQPQTAALRSGPTRRQRVVILAMTLLLVAPLLTVASATPAEARLQNQAVGSFRLPPHIAAGVVRAARSLIYQINHTNFNQLFGGAGTIIAGDNWRIDMQGVTSDGAHNIQLQRGANTYATVLIPGSLSDIDGNAQNPDTAAYFEVRELVNRVRSALLSSLFQTINRDNPTTYSVEGTYSNAPQGRRLMSVEADIVDLFNEAVPAGPLGGQTEAAEYCPEAAAAAGHTWDGNWTTTETGIMSVCGVVPLHAVFPGPIWHNDQAQSTCPAATPPGLEWTGHWLTPAGSDDSYCVMSG